MTDLATLKIWLTEAETANHKLQCGIQAVEFMKEGRKVVYTAANADKLRAYIAQLKTEIAAHTGNNSRRPLYFRLP